MTYLKRKIDDFLLKWKEGKDKKPLIVKGCRQVGETKSIRHFSKVSLKSISEKTKSIKNSLRWV